MSDVIEIGIQRAHDVMDAVKTRVCPAGVWRQEQEGKNSWMFEVGGVDTVIVTLGSTLSVSFKQGYGATAKWCKFIYDEDAVQTNRGHVQLGERLKSVANKVAEDFILYRMRLPWDPLPGGVVLPWDPPSNRTSSRLSFAALDRELHLCTRELETLLQMEGS